MHNVCLPFATCELCLPVTVIVNSLCLLAPEMIIPDLLEKLSLASESLTEPHRFHVCIQVCTVGTGTYLVLYFSYDGWGMGDS